MCDAGKGRKDRNNPEQTDYYTSSQAHLYPRIDLLDLTRGNDGPPFGTSLVDRSWNLQRLDLRRLLEDIDREAGGGMPGDMAVESPGAGVVRSGLPHHVPELGHHLDISALWIVGPHDRLAVPSAPAHR